MSRRLGQLLREERRERGETQRTCAPRFGISQPGYARWEGGDNDPERPHWPAIASFLGVEVDEIRRILDGDDVPAPGAELGERVDQLEAEAKSIKRELAAMRRERADMQRALDNITKLLEQKAARRSR